MSSPQPTRVLVTGPTGFLGSRLCEMLLEAGCEVHGLCRPGSAALPVGVHRRECAFDAADPLRQLIGDVRPERIFHVAGFTSAARDLAAVVPSFQANLVSTVHLLAAAAEIGCRRIVLAGSFEEPPTPGAVPSSPYAASKAASTAYAQMFWQLYRTPVTVARIYMVYGPAQRDIRKLIPYTILSLLRGERPQFTSGARQVDWIFVDDVVRGIIALGEADGVDGGSVDLGTGVLTSVREVVETIAGMIEPRVEPSFGDVPDRPQEQVRGADVERAHALLGWTPSVGLRDGLRQTIEYYRRRSDLHAP